MWVFSIVEKTFRKVLRMVPAVQSNNWTNYYHHYKAHTIDTTHIQYQWIILNSEWYGVSTSIIIEFAISIIRKTIWIKMDIVKKWTWWPYILNCRLTYATSRWAMYIYIDRRSFWAIINHIQVITVEHPSNVGTRLKKQPNFAQLMYARGWW